MKTNLYDNKGKLNVGTLEDAIDAIDDDMDSLASMNQLKIIKFIIKLKQSTMIFSR